MDFNKLFEDLARAPQVIEKAKVNPVRVVEDSRLDFYSAQEVIDAALASIRARYYEHDFTEIDFRAERLKKALQDAHEIDALEEEELSTQMRVNDET